MELAGGDCLTGCNMLVWPFASALGQTALELGGNSPSRSEVWILIFALERTGLELEPMLELD